MAEWTHLQMRFPPFDAPSHHAKEIDPVNVVYQSIEGSPDLSLGGPEGWFIQRTNVGVIPERARLVSPFGGEEETRRLLAGREGWALPPNQLHKFARKWIPYGVITLIIAIFLHVLEPVLVNSGILSDSLAGSINLGLLDYPILFVLASPFVAFPLLLRIIANVEDVRRQHRFKKSSPTPPVVSVSDFNAGESVDIKVDLDESLPVTQITGYIRVGLLPPHRDAIMSAFNDGEGRPPISLSTPLPEGWMPVADDGSGVGEATPMVVGRGPARLFQEPMRISERGDKVAITPGSRTTLEPPSMGWPGSEFGPFVNINWELVLKLFVKDMKPLYWIQRLDATSAADRYEISDLQAASGRLEID